MKFKYIIILFFIQVTLFAQSPILVSDFNPGSASTFDDGRTQTSTINGTTLLWIETESNGREMGYLKDGNLAILKDIFVGAESSNPFSHEIIAYKNQFYFPAFTESSNGSELWVSDGTPEGTRVFDDRFGDTRGLILSKNNLLYYFKSNVLLVTDGESIDTVFSGVKYNGASQATDHNICTYKDEIAFLRQANNNEIELYILENGVPTLKATRPAGSGFPQIFGMNQVGDNIAFIVYDPFNADLSGSFLYNAENETIESFQINGRDIIRMHQFSEDYGLAYESQSGYYAVNDTEGEEEFLASATNITLTQNQDIVRAVYQDKMVLAAQQEFFGGCPIVFSDGTSAGTSVLHDGYRNPPISILMHEGYAFFIYEYAFKDYRLSYINMSDGTTGNIYDFNDTETGFESFPLSVQNGKIFMAINYQEGLGLELYSLDLDINVATTQLDEVDFLVDYRNQAFSIQYEDNIPVKVDVFSANGSLLENINTMTNISHSIEHHEGLLFLRFEVNGQTRTKSILRR